MTDSWNPRPDQSSQQWQQQADQQSGFQPGHQPWHPNQPPAGPARSGGRGRLLTGIAIGVVAAVLVGAVLVFTNVLGFGSNDETAGPDTTPITLPTQLGGLRDQLDVTEDKAKNSTDAEKAHTATKARLDHTYALTTERYQQAFNGAAVAVRSYADDELQFLPTVIAVRASSPGLVNGPISDPADLGVAVSASAPYVQQHGLVECLLVSTETVLPGHEVDPDRLLTTTCRRANDAVTVYVHGLGEGTAGNNQMVALTNAAFDAIAGAGQG